MSLLLYQHPCFIAAKNIRICLKRSPYCFTVTDYRCFLPKGLSPADNQEKWLQWRDPDPSLIWFGMELPFVPDILETDAPLGIRELERFSQDVFRQSADSLADKLDLPGFINCFREDYRELSASSDFCVVNYPFRLSQDILVSCGRELFLRALKALFLDI